MAVGLQQDPRNRIRAISWAAPAFAYVWFTASTNAGLAGTSPPPAPLISFVGDGIIGQIDDISSTIGVQGPDVTHYYIWYGFAPAPDLSNYNNNVFVGAGAGGAGNVGLPGTNYSQQFSLVYVNGFGDWQRSFPLDALSGDFTSPAGAANALAAFNAHYAANIQGGVDHRGYFTSSGGQVPPPSSNGSGGFPLTNAFLAPLDIPADPPTSSTGNKSTALFQVPLPKPGQGSVSATFSVSVPGNNIALGGARGMSDVPQIFPKDFKANSDGTAPIPANSEASTDQASSPHGGSFTVECTIITNPPGSSKAHTMVLSISGGTGAQGAT